MKNLKKFTRRVYLLGVMLILSTITPSSAFECGPKRYCREMDNCAEAVFYYTRCNLTELDADHDGIPCELSCGNTSEIFSSRLKAQTGGLGLSVFETGNRPGIGVGLSQATTGFQCMGKRSCKEMRSCEEAKFNFQECGLTQIDPDHDDIPCEGLCSC